MCQPIVLQDVVRCAVEPFGVKTEHVSWRRARSHALGISLKSSCNSLRAEREKHPAGRGDDFSFEPGVFNRTFASGWYCAFFRS